MVPGDLDVTERRRSRLRAWGMGKYPTPPYPPVRHLTEEEQSRVLRKLDALDDVLLFSAEADPLRPLIAACRVSVAAGTLRCSHVRPLARLFDRFGI